MLKFDRYGFNDDYGVFRSRCCAEKVAKTLTHPAIIKSDMIEGEKVFALWSPTAFYVDLERS